MLLTCRYLKYKCFKLSFKFSFANSHKHMGIISSYSMISNLVITALGV